MTQNEDGLVKNEHVFGSRHVTVSEASGLMGVMRGKYILELQEITDRDPYVQRYLEEIYAPLKACSTGDIPNSPEDFLSMKEEDIENWISSARALNPHWFVWLEAAEKIILEAMTDEQKKKKSKTRSRSKKS